MKHTHVFELYVDSPWGDLYTWQWFRWQTSSMPPAEYIRRWACACGEEGYEVPA